MDMGLYRCLPYLAQSGMGQNKTVDQIRADYPMVVGARVWLQVHFEVVDEAPLIVSAVPNGS